MAAWIPSMVVAAHPRACGEHVVTEAAHAALYGSSPRLRGTFGSGIARAPFCRFIPAPAGNIQVGRGAVFGRTVHPRACGEHLSGPQVVDLAAGSSPRLRGT